MGLLIRSRARILGDHLFGGVAVVNEPQLMNSALEQRAERRRTGSAPALLPFRRGWRDPLRRRMLALADVAALFLGSLCLGLAFDSDVQGAVWSIVVVPAWLVFAKLFGLYDRDHMTLRHLTVDELPAIFFWTLTATAGTALLLHATPAGGLSFSEGTRFWVATAGAAVVFRSVARFAWRRATAPERVYIFGEGPLADATRRKLELFPDIHAQPVDVASLGPEDIVNEPERLVELRIDRIIVATDSISEQLIADFVAMCRRYAIKFSLVPPAQGMFGTATGLSRVADLPVLEYNTWDVSRSTLFLKRTLDLAVSFTALIVLSPLFLIIALAILVDSPGSAIYSQVRVGAGGSRFRMHKFRTMVKDAEDRLPQLVSFDALSEPMFKLANDPRVTRVGKLLRRSSLDELPQLFNVFKGEMSLVGPRPEQVELVERYSPDARFRLAVRPGLTGPMQIYGRGELTFQERLSVERDYVENLSISRDFRILALTVAPVVKGRGAF
jgi:exopolysaccharide biosynthesis polyprenyl glycosylphosphotransferase